MSTLSGHHDRTVFSVDWSARGTIATGVDSCQMMQHQRCVHLCPLACIKLRQGFDFVGHLHIDMSFLPTIDLLSLARACYLLDESFR